MIDPAAFRREMVYALDEMRETTRLLRPAADAFQKRATRRDQSPWWSLWWSVWSPLLGFARSSEETTNGQVIEYFVDNLGRARGHWRAALAHVDGLEPSLRSELIDVGVERVDGGLHTTAVPLGNHQTAAHLKEIIAVIERCIDVVGTRLEGK
jgi:hypothetical protein